jgi:hypothetical protein
MNGFLHPKKEKLHPDGLEAQTVIPASSDYKRRKWRKPCSTFLKAGSKISTPAEHSYFSV